jgi:hypothetical protein
MGYERKYSQGRIILCRPKDCNIKGRLRNDIPISQIKAIRKALEVACVDNIALLFNGATIYGFGLPKPGVPYLELTFHGFHNWFATKWNKKREQLIIFQSLNATPRLPIEKITFDKFKSKIKKVFTLSEFQLRKLWSIIDICIKSNKGSILIIDAHADAEVERLSNQAFLIEPSVINKDLLKGMLCVDGAVFLDINSKCHGFGVILDGVSHPNKGDRNRGSRFNSVIKYVNSREGMCFGVVFSDDGYIDIIS